VNRRGFLGFLGLTGAVALVHPKYFLSPRGGWIRQWEIYKTTERFSLNSADWRGIYGTGDGVSLNSTAHPERPGPVDEVGFRCYLGHPYCNLHVKPVDLNEETLERMLINIRDSGIRPLVIKPKWIGRA
jgi:hypothetical protein